MQAMTKRLLAGVAAIGLAAAVWTGPASAQQIKLTLADQNSPTAWGPEHALTPWVKQVEEATKGRVKIDVYPSQTLIKGVEMWKGIRSGIADIGWCVQSYWPDLTPLSDVISLPGLPIPSAEKGSEALWKLYEKFPSIQKEYGDIQPIVLYTATPFFLLSNKKQIKTVDDLKGMKIRVVGGPAIQWIKALGAVPTPMPMPDVYQSLEKGVIDAAGTPWEAVHGFRLFEVGQYYTMAPLATAYFSLCTNKSKWDGLPADVREQIMSVSGLNGAKFWGKNFFDTPEQEVYAVAKKANRPIIRYDLPADELAKFRKSSEPVWEEWVVKMEAKGHKEAREILNTTLQLLAN